MKRVVHDKRVLISFEPIHIMTRPLTQIVAIHIILQLLLHVDTAPYSVQDFKSLFANPVRDFIKLFSRVGPQKSFNISESENANDTNRPSMIDVPFNERTCKNGAVKDVDGICRTTF